ncbi:hypothetical protein [Pseudomonas sp. H3(2019)]|uniref:hypothetical protein n=1 Tax=Pseudomonas sp. H3(2019) TaxID=2598724 RepID=UPI00273FDC7B|nr:hypothetical protein [Pseudomonas sp. H3(2019)]
MQEPITLPPLLITPDSQSAPPKETPAFPSDFDSILFWDGAVPTVTTPYHIDRIKSTRNAYEKLVAIAVSAQGQIKSAFLGSDTNIQNYLEKYTASTIDAHQPNALEAALKKKAVIVELLKIVMANRIGGSSSQPRYCCRYRRVVLLTRSWQWRTLSSNSTQPAWQYTYAGAAV